MPPSGDFDASFGGRRPPDCMFHVPQKLNCSYSKISMISRNYFIGTCSANPYECIFSWNFIL